MTVMTYNVYITIALVIGGSLGYWIFSPTLVQLKMQQFYHKQAIMECDKNCEGNTIKLISLKKKTHMQSYYHILYTIITNCSQLS